MSSNSEELTKGAKQAAKSYWFIRLRRSSIALLVALPLMGGFTFIEKVLTDSKSEIIHPAYWYMLTTTSLSSILAFWLYKYIKSKSEPSVFIATLIFFLIAILGLSGFGFIGAVT
ncbi:hypothetical protein NBRC116493_36040 [Aurantivibrio infirmus]